MHGPQATPHTPLPQLHSFIPFGHEIVQKSPSVFTVQLAGWTVLDEPPHAPPEHENVVCVQLWVPDSEHVAGWSWMHVQPVTVVAAHMVPLGSTHDLLVLLVVGAQVWLLHTRSVFVHGSVPAHELFGAPPHLVSSHVVVDGPQTMPSVEQAWLRVTVLPTHAPALQVDTVQLCDCMPAPQIPAVPAHAPKLPHESALQDCPWWAIALTHEPVLGSQTPSLHASLIALQSTGVKEQV